MEDKEFFAAKGEYVTLLEKIKELDTPLQALQKSLSNKVYPIKKIDIGGAIAMLNQIEKMQDELDVLEVRAAELKSKWGFK
jgi:fructose-bisphosphate aldolase class 1